MTSGLFYDVIDGGGGVIEEIGKRFEAYAELAFLHLAPEFEIQREFSYKTKLGERKSSDLMILDDNRKVSHLIECKANRLSRVARFGDFQPDDRGYLDMIKGVTQIWRFVADVRAGLTDCEIAASPIGGILTLDSWFVAAPKRQNTVIEKAREICDSKYPEVAVADQIPIAFLYMSEFERGMAMGQARSLLDTFAFLATSEGRGYQFDIAMRRDGEKFGPTREFPFEDYLNELLPWWRNLAKLREESDNP